MSTATRDERGVRTLGEELVVLDGRRSGRRAPSRVETSPHEPRHRPFPVPAATALGAHRTCRAPGGAVVLRDAEQETIHRTVLWRVLHVQASAGGPPTARQSSRASA
jgi:hypothetical protein